ncbi:GNAT family N-acetyltransferase [Mucilaginibacter celer]|uniref:GNAT family N-acetyltransferase n=1 Tax=Mucilaginibacter celer TaxID=2305508 RepID=A0A494VUT2_9SPHI|nr:GNAT family N-acetyltransferase [Mucilaginibacter celer]AYL97240.1 GNAT family N-acetyltransferase [Mucilaginibacter celer]
MIALPAHRYGLIFRLVEEHDAGFILSLRTDPKLSKHVSPVSNDLEAQKAWIRNYKERELLGEEYYFLYTDAEHEPQGVFRLYNIDGDTVTSGSWLAKSGGDELNPIKADLFLTWAIFEGFGFERCLIDVRKDNKKLVRYHKMFFTQTGEDEQNIYMVMHRDGYQRKLKFLTDIIDPK